MPRFAANISLLFTELPYLDRFSAAADAGFGAVEILFPYDVPAKETHRALMKNGLGLVLINAPPPNQFGGAPGFAALPGEEARFEHDIRRSLRYADELGAGLIHVMAGYVSGSKAKATFIRNLQWVADLAPKQDFTVEPLNAGDQPGYFLDDYDLAAEILDSVARPNVGLQYDSYHAQIIHGDAAGTWSGFSSLVRHVQLGAAPGRSEPAPGLIDFPTLFDAIDGSGYTGWVSAEYHPSTARTKDSLQWMR